MRYTIEQELIHGRRKSDEHDYGCATFIGGICRTTIINDQTLTIEAGVITGLIGPNGSGKSTLLNVMNGFRAPLAGRVLLKDRPLSTFNHKQRAAEIACLTQHPVAPEGITVAELVSYGRYCHSKGLGWLRRRDQISVTEAISTVHLTAFKDTLVSELSGANDSGPLSP